MTTDIELEVHSSSLADDLGYLGQQAVAVAAKATDYRIVGGHMVRLLLLAHPAERAVQRTTVDADTAVNDVEVIGGIVERLVSQEFVQERGNVYTKAVDDERKVEINLLLSRMGGASGIKPQNVDGVGQVDTLPELAFVLLHPALRMAVTAHLSTGETLADTVLIPGLEEAFILKAHAWAARGLQKDRDLADMHTLLEIRETYPDLPWRLNERPLRGYRLDTARARNQQRVGPAVRSVDEPGVARSGYRDFCCHEVEVGIGVRQASSLPSAVGSASVSVQTVGPTAPSRRG